MANLSDFIPADSGVIATYGSYIPTATVTTGTATVQQYVTTNYWTRINNTVTVYGSFSTVNPSLGDIVVAITLPVTTANFGSVANATGKGTGTNSGLNLRAVLWVQAEVGGQRVEIKQEASTTNNYGWHYCFTYQIQN